MTWGEFKRQGHVCRWVKGRFGKRTSVGCTQPVSFHLHGMRKRLRKYPTMWCRDQRHGWINHLKFHKRGEPLMLTPGLDVLCGRWAGRSSMSQWVACPQGQHVIALVLCQPVQSVKEFGPYNFPRSWGELQWSLKTWFPMCCLEGTYCHEGFTYSNGKWEMPEVLWTVPHSSATPSEYSYTWQRGPGKDRTHILIKDQGSSSHQVQKHYGASFQALCPLWPLLHVCHDQRLSYLKPTSGTWGSTGPSLQSMCDYELRICPAQRSFSGAGLLQAPPQLCTLSLWFLYLCSPFVFYPTCFRKRKDDYTRALDTCVLSE